MRKIIFVFLIIMLTVYGCRQDTGSVATRSSEDPFVGGTDGLIISFEEDAPPDEVFDGGDFPFEVVVKLKNEGESAIAKEDVQVSIVGILPSQFSKTEAELSKNPNEDIRANRKDAEGETDESEPVFVEFEGFNHADMLAGNTEFTMRADVCYTYTSKAQALVCQKEDNLDDDEEDVCTVNEKKTVHSSGAPIIVENFKESARAKDKIAFTFDIVHKGNGLIFQKNTTCEDERIFEDKIFVEVKTGLPGLECLALNDGTANTGFIKLFGTEKPITCTQLVNTTVDSEFNAEIELTYDYEETKKKSFLVKHQIT